MNTLREHVLWAEARFEQAKLYFGHGTDNARDEAAWLAMHVAQIPHDRLDAEAERVLTAEQSATFKQLAEQRIITRKPLAYLIHEAWFAGLSFYVDERVIVPRSILGEFMLDAFRKWIKPDTVKRILDLCTGSGCIAIAAARAFPQARVDAADISTDALAVAAINVERHGLKQRVRLVHSDLFAALKDERYDLILTNPPYVDARDMASLPAEYRHEPELALASGSSGLNAILKILAAAAEHLTADGVLIAEVGNSHVALRQRMPALTWLRSPSGDESVFLVRRKTLEKMR
jgi:ribosomal protein L3 glutamine methyltransferase